MTTVDPRAKDAPNTVTKQGKFSFGGHGNITNAAESLILAGEENNLSANTSIVGASKKIVGNQGEGNTVLSSSDITFTGTITLSTPLPILKSMELGILYFQVKMSLSIPSVLWQ